MTERGFKVPKPKEFDGSNPSLNAVNEWVYSVEEYIDLTGIPRTDRPVMPPFSLSATPRHGS